MEKKSKLNCIVIINYNNWQDTIVCLKSINEIKPQNTKVIIVDNFSQNESVKKIEHWFNNQSHYNEFYPKWFNITDKNEQIKYEVVEYDKIDEIDKNRDYYLIKTSRNGGFSYGNNVGLKVAYLLDNEFFFWLLNNDTYINSETLPSLIQYFNSDNYGLIGSKILNFNPPHDIQARYGNFNPKTCRNTIVRSENSKLPVTYPLGASLFSSSKILDEVGLMDERYFLYYEELDFSFKVNKAGYKVGICENSIVFHQQGASTNFKRNQRKKNLFVVKVKYQSLLKFYKKNYPTLMYAAYFYLIKGALGALLKFEIKRAFLAFRIIFYRK